MRTLFEHCGVWSMPLTLLSLIVLGLTIRKAVQLVRTPAAGVPTIREGLHTIPFWGATCAVIGLLGQFSGTYFASTVIARAEEISPRVVAAGLAETLTSTIWGLCVLLFSGIAWFALSALGAKRSRV